MIIFLYSDLLLIHPCLFLIHYLPLTHLHSLHITLSQVIHLTQPIQSIASILQLLPLHRLLNTLPNPLFNPTRFRLISPHSTFHSSFTLLPVSSPFHSYISSNSLLHSYTLPLPNSNPVCSYPC